MGQMKNRPKSHPLYLLFIFASRQKICYDNTACINGKKRTDKTFTGMIKMTLQQLKYMITVADKGTITDAARELFISQPSLTNQIKAREKEMNITIFNRTNKGISLSKEGEIFLGYARQVLEQAHMLEEKYKGKDTVKRQFCISTQHYSFAVNAFVELIEKCGGEKAAWGCCVEPPRSLKLNYISLSNPCFS